MWSLPRRTPVHRPPLTAQRAHLRVICSSAATAVSSAAAKRTHYQVLGVQPAASSDDIRTAFRRLAKSLHPDHNKLPGAREKFEEVKQAYDILCDLTARADYDHQLKVQAMAAAAAAAQVAAGGRRAATFSVRRNRASGSANSHAAARPASGDDFDVFTGASSPARSGSGSNGSGGSYNSIFSDFSAARARSTSTSRSGSRSGSAYRSVFDGSQQPKPTGPAAGSPTASSPSPTASRAGAVAATAAAAARAVSGQAGLSGSDGGYQSIFGAAAGTPRSGAGANTVRSSGSSSPGPSSRCIFNGRAISPKLNVTPVQPTGAAAAPQPPTPPPAAPSPSPPSPPRAAMPPAATAAPAASWPGAAIDERTHSPSAAAGAANISTSAQGAVTSFADVASATTAGPYAPPGFNTQSGTATGTHAAKSPAAVWPASTAPTVVGSGSTNGGQSVVRAAAAARASPSPATQAAAGPAAFDTSSSLRAAALPPAAVWPAPAPPAAAASVRPSSAASTASGSPSASNAAPPPAGPAAGSGTSMAARSTATSAAGGVSIGDVASRLVAMAAVAASRSASGGSGGGGYVSVFGGSPTHITLSTPGSRPSSPSRASIGVEAAAAGPPAGTSASVALSAGAGTPPAPPAAAPSGLVPQTAGSEGPSQTSRRAVVAGPAPGNFPLGIQEAEAAAAAAATAAAGFQVSVAPRVALDTPQLQPVAGQPPATVAASFSGLAPVVAPDTAPSSPAAGNAASAAAAAAAAAAAVADAQAAARVAAAMAAAAEAKAAAAAAEAMAAQAAAVAAAAKAAAIVAEARLSAVVAGADDSDVAPGSAPGLPEAGHQQDPSAADGAGATAGTSALWPPCAPVAGVAPQVHDLMRRFGAFFAP